MSVSAEFMARLKNRARLVGTTPTRIVDVACADLSGIGPDDIEAMQERSHSPSVEIDARRRSR